MHKLLFLLAASLAAAGCTSTFKVGQIDPATNRFKTVSAVDAEEIKISKPLEVNRHKQLLFVRSNLDIKETWDSYFEESLEAYGYFDVVARKDEFERLLIQRGAADRVSSVDGFTGLTQAQKSYGDFLVVDFDVEGGAAYQVDAKMSVYDPANAELVFQVERGITNWGGLDGTLFEPMFNAFFDWIEQNSGQSQAPMVPVSAESDQTGEDGGPPAEPGSAADQ